MKYIYTTLALLITLNLFSQDAIRFHPEFKENSKYLTKMDTRTLSSSVQTKDTTAVNMPAMDMRMKMVLLQVTKTRRENGTVPMIIKYDTISMESAGVPQGMNDMESLLENVKVYTSIYDGYKIAVDSIIGSASDPVIQQVMTQTIEQLTGAVEFPDHEISVGDSFEQDYSKLSPISSQIPGATMMMTYTLHKVENNIAYFTSSMNLEGDMGSIMKMTGNGNGTMNFDLNNNYIKHNNMLMTIVMDMNMGEEGMRMEVTLDQKMNIQLIK